MFVNHEHNLNQFSTFTVIFFFSKFVVNKTLLIHSVLNFN